MNRKQRKAKKMGVVVIAFVALTCLFASFVFGIQEKWFRFGVFLAGCIITAVFFMGVVLQLGIDERFNRLEKLIDELKDEKPKREQNNK